MICSVTVRQSEPKPLESMTPSEPNSAAGESPTELLVRREQLMEWLRRLDGLDDIPAQVASRVRTDYEQRLATVVDELAAHRDQLADERQRLDDELLAAAERHDGAVDALEEVRLRHRIGELSPDEWDTRRPALEAEVESAAQERSATEQEIAGLDELLGQIAAAAPAGPPVELPTVAGWTDGDAEFAAAADEWSPDFPESDFDGSVSAAIIEPAGSEPVDELVDVDALAPIEALEEEEDEGEAEPSRNNDLGEITSFADAAEAMADRVDRPAADDDMAFLEELDRTIAATAPRTPNDDEPPAEGRPQPGLKCPECGYSNDPAAWYCGVCGVDLG